MKFDFDFSELINDNSVEFIAEVPSNGYYNDAGDFVNDKPKQYKLRGAIISYKESKIFRSEGALTSNDKALYMLQPLENAIQMAKILYKGKIYSVGETLSNADFTGVWAYVLKYVSAFKDSSPEYDISEEVDDLEERLDGVLEKTGKTPVEPDFDDDFEALEKRLGGE